MILQPPKTKLYVGQPFQMSVKATDSSNLEVNQNVEFHVHLFRLTNGEWVASDQKLFHQCGKPRVPLSQSDDGVDGSMGECEQFSLLKAIGVGNFTDAIFTKAGFYKIQFYLGAPWMIQSLNTTSIEVLPQDIDMWPWYKLRFKADRKPPKKTEIAI